MGKNENTPPIACSSEPNFLINYWEKKTGSPVSRVAGFGFRKSQQGLFSSLPYPHVLWGPHNSVLIDVK
jgi:hypothetical protein